jgi:hypothetical protein
MFQIFDKIRALLGYRVKLTYEERIMWFMENYYESGMEKEVLMDNLKNEDLDNFKWYNEVINIPKYKDEL